MCIEELMKKLTILLLLFVISLSYSDAQIVGSKWLEVQKLKDHTVFLDTTNLRRVENQVTTVCIYQYKKPILISAYNKDASLIKSQIMFNLSTKSFIVLGTLYYDNKLRIIGESSIPGFSLGNETFTTPIDSNETMAAVYDKCIELLDIDTSLIVRTENTNHSILNFIDSNKEVYNSIISDSSDEEPGNVIDRDKFIDKDDLAAKNTQLLQRSTENTSDKSNQNNNENYNSSSETNPVSTIFTDGSKYCFQVSSWKQKTKAQSEVEKLKSKGFDAFITQAYLPSKGGTWYRVRIGYFSSIEETENNMRKLK